MHEFSCCSHYIKFVPWFGVILLCYWFWLRIPRNEDLGSVDRKRISVARNYEVILEKMVGFQLSDFEFRAIYIPSSVPDRSGQQIKDAGFETNWSLILEPEHSSKINRLHMGLGEYTDYPSIISVNHLEPCHQGIMYTSGNNSNKQINGTLKNSNFNRFRYAQSHNYCLLHLRCRDNTSQLLRRASDTSTGARFDLEKIIKKIWVEQLNRPLDKIHFAGADPYCPSRINPYFWKFIGFLKLIELYDPFLSRVIANAPTRAIHFGTNYFDHRSQVYSPLFFDSLPYNTQCFKPRTLLAKPPPPMVFVDDDVLITNMQMKIKDWVDANHLKSQFLAIGKTWFSFKFN